MFSGDEHVGVARRDALHQLEHRLHGRRLRDQVGQATLAQALVFLLQALGYPEGAGQLDLGAEGREQPGVVPRLFDEVAGAESHRFDGLVDAPPGGHDDDGEGGIETADPRQQVQPFPARGGVAGVVQIDEGGISLLSFQQRDDPLGHMRRRGTVPFGFQEQSKGFDHIILVVGDEDQGSGQPVCPPRRSAQPETIPDQEAEDAVLDGSRRHIGDGGESAKIPYGESERPDVDTSGSD